MPRKTALVDARPIELESPAEASWSARLRRYYRSGRFTTILIFLPPALLLFTLFVILPVAEAGFYSFFNWNGYGFPQRVVGLDNFRRAMLDPIFRNSLLNNLWVILVSIGLQVPLAMWLALLISDRRRSSTVFRAIFFVPYILAEVVAGLIWRYLYDGDYGLVAMIYGWFGADAPYVLAERGLATLALLLVVVWKYFGFHMALFIAGRQNVPDDVLESAKIDGASRWQMTSRIILPMMRPTIVLSVFFSLLGSLQLFDLIIPLTGGEPLNSTHSAVSYLYTFGIKRMRVGYGSAVGVVLFVICVLVMVFYKRLFMREKEVR
jgi:raffinose/stachyose/melibiose transport system permease protein